MRNPATFSNSDPDSTQISKHAQIHRICYTLTPKIDHFSESYPDSRTSSQHVSEWHHLRNHVSESTYEKIHARNPNIMRNTNPRSLGFKKHYPKSLQRFCIYPESKHYESHGY